MNVADTASKLEPAQQPASPPKSNTAPLTATESIALPFGAILKWLTQDEQTPGAGVAEKKKDKPSKDSENTAIAELPTSAVNVKPPISLSIAFNVSDGSQPQLKNHASDGPSGAEPVQSKIGKSDLATTATDAQGLIAFALTLTEPTPGIENAPVHTPGPIQESVLPQTIGGVASVFKEEVSSDGVASLGKQELSFDGVASLGKQELSSDGVASLGKQELSPNPVKASAKPDPIGEIQDTPRQNQEQHSKDTLPEKQPEVPHAAEQHTVLQTGAEITGIKSDKTQSPGSPPSVQPDTAKAELKNETNPTVRPPPAREISLKMAGADSGSVDLRISERAGKVHVDVRTADGNLARSLRADLGDLVGRLENRGLKTETWTPGAQASVKSGRAETSSEHDSEHAPGGGGGQQNQRDNQQRRSRQQHEPDWVGQLKTGTSFEQRIKEIHDNIRR